MRTIVLTVIFISTCCLAVAQTVGPQRVINSTGGSFKKGYHVIDWSIGELAVIDQFKDAEQSCIITNGYIQAFTEFRHFTDTPNIFTPGEIRILPNPTQGRLEVNFLLHEKGQIQMTLFDALGNRVQTRQFPIYGYGRFERIDMSGLASSTYLLYIELKGSNGYQDRKGIYKITKIK
jgi:hypothetical protein